MNKSERKKLTDRIARSIELIISHVEKKSSPETKKQIRAASKRLVKKLSSTIKKENKGRKQKIKKVPGKKIKGRKTGK